MSDPLEQSLSKRDKHMYAIYMKVKIYCLNEVTLQNILVIVCKVCHELNKIGPCLGVTKKDLCVKIIMLLLNDFGSEGLKELITEEFVENLIEEVYRNNLHRNFKPKNSGCVIF